MKTPKQIINETVADEILHGATWTASGKVLVATAPGEYDWALVEILRVAGGQRAGVPGGFPNTYAIRRILRAGVPDAPEFMSKTEYETFFDAQKVFATT